MLLAVAESLWLDLLAHLNISEEKGNFRPSGKGVCFPRLLTFDRAPNQYPLQVMFGLPDAVGGIPT